jgi:hypothetical protein
MFPQTSGSGCAEASSRMLRFIIKSRQTQFCSGAFHFRPLNLNSNTAINTGKAATGFGAHTFIIAVVLLSVVALGGLVVSVLATGLKVRGFKPGR